MTGSNLYEIKTGESFRSGSKQIRKYYKKERKSDSMFMDRLADILERLMVNPDALIEASTEPWPKNFSSRYPGWSFRKIRFDLPLLSGAVSCGRLIFLRNDELRVICLLILYTHKDFEGRPPDKALRQLIEEATSE